MPRYGSWWSGQCTHCHNFGGRDRPVWYCRLCRQPTCRNCVYLFMSFQRNEVRWNENGRQFINSQWMDWCVCYTCYVWASSSDPSQWVTFQRLFARYMAEWESVVFLHILRATQSVYEEVRDNLATNMMQPAEVPDYFHELHADLERLGRAFGVENPTLMDAWDWDL